jgi:hypothetical protein
VAGFFLATVTAARCNGILEEEAMKTAWILLLLIIAIVVLGLLPVIQYL